jgi:hypothetical protein
MLVRIHEQIVRAAFADILAPAALKVVVTANRHSDLYQWAPERHFDNANDLATLGGLWRRGLHAYLARVVACAAPTGARGETLRNQRGALKALGMATHALADFYAHTNWIELLGPQAGLAPLLDDAFPAAQLPSDLQSGYFSLRFGLRGCPSRAGVYMPPPGFRYCHAELNKDAPDRGHGAERVLPGTPAGPTYHEVAVRLATCSTRALWEALRRRLRTAYPVAEALAEVLAGQAGPAGQL